MSPTRSPLASAGRAPDSPAPGTAASLAGSGRASRSAGESPHPRLSIVVPFYNEEEAAPGVIAELVATLDGDTRDVEAAALPSWEVIAVDDGSRDATAALLLEAARHEPRLRVLRLRANAGQTAAFDAGFRAARGELIAMMDGDGQNDPRDFARLIAALDASGADMACGWRARRHDSLVRIVSSRIANGVRNRLTREQVRDVGCSIRVFRRGCLDRLKLYNGMHRFFPTLVRMEGHTFTEIPVNHRPRTKGRSKYGIHNRLWRGLRDLFAVRWMQSRVLRYEVVRDDDADGTGAAAAGEASRAPLAAQGGPR